MAMSASRLLASLAALVMTGAASTAPASCPADGTWDRTTDFGWTCRYRADNARLIAARVAVPVVFMGDSITEGWALADPAFFAGGRVDRGISGQTTPQMMLRFDQDVIALKPAVVHIMAGTNDIAGNTGDMTLDAIEANIRTMAETARRHRIRVVIGSVLPSRAFGWHQSVHPAATIIALNAWLKAYAERRGFAYADYHTALAEPDGGMPANLSRDGVHPNKAAYAIMRPIAEAAIQRAMAARR